MRVLLWLILMDAEVHNCDEYLRVYIHTSRLTTDQYLKRYRQQRTVSACMKRGESYRASTAAEVNR